MRMQPFGAFSLAALLLTLAGCGPGKLNPEKPSAELAMMLPFEPLAAASFSPDAQTLYLGGTALHTVPVANPKAAKELEQHGAITNLVVLPGGQEAAAIAADFTLESLYVIDLASGERRSVFGDDKEFTSTQPSPEEYQKFLDTRSQRSRQISTNVSDVALAPSVDGQSLYSVRYSKVDGVHNILRWNLAIGDYETFSPQSGNEGNVSLVVSPSGKLLVFSAGSELSLIDAESGSTEQVVRLGDGPRHGPPVFVDERGERLRVVFENKVYEIDTHAGEVEPICNLNEATNLPDNIAATEVTGASLSQDGNRVAVIYDPSSSGRYVAVWDLAAQQPIFLADQSRPKDDDSRQGPEVLLSPDGQTLFSLTETGLYAWKLPAK